MSNGPLLHVKQVPADPTTVDPCAKIHKRFPEPKIQAGLTMILHAHGVCLGIQKKSSRGNFAWLICGAGGRPER